VSRTDPPFGVERLRAQGEVSDIGGSSLAFGVGEIEALVTSLLDADVVPREATGDAAARIFTATGGWPAAVRLTIEALRAAPAGGREAVLDRLQRPEGPLFAYLAEEVVAAASEAVRRTLAHAVHFERFSGPLLEAAGVAGATEVLERLARRALFLQPLPGDPGWYALHGLIREYTKARLPLEPAEIAALHLNAAAWLESNDRLDGALAHLHAAGDEAALAAFLDRYGPMLVIGGATRQVTEAAAALPDSARTPRLERACGRRSWSAATGGPRPPRSRDRPAAPIGSTPRPRGVSAWSTGFAGHTTRRSRSTPGQS
jgi:ATP/maltotriose-dependent transcriptional regulator MalT